MFQKRWTRRSTLALGAAGFAGLMLPGGAEATGIPAGNRIAFDVSRGDDPMGRHTIDFTQDGARTIVDVAIDLEVKIAFITAFRYTHRNREIWEDGRLVQLDSTTDDDGTEYGVQVRREGDQLRIQSNVHGEKLVAGDLLPSSYWNVGTLQQTQLIDSAQGRILDIATETHGDSVLQLQGRTVVAKKHRIDSTIPIDVWYTSAGQWVGLRFDARGAAVNYILAEDSGLLV